MTKQSRPLSLKTLSKAGQQRRDQMLVDLQVELKQAAGRRRLKNRVAMTTIPILLLALGIWWTTAANDHVGKSNMVKKGVSENGQPTDLNVAKPFAMENVVETNRDGVLDRYLVRSDQVQVRDVQKISDEQLLDLLAQVGQPSVLGRIGGELAVIPIEIPSPQ